MILGQVSYVDCLAFLIFLIPQLFLHVNLFELAFCVLKAIPFLGKSHKSSLILLEKR